MPKGSAPQYGSKSNKSRLTLRNLNVKAIDLLTDGKKMVDLENPRTAHHQNDLTVIYLITNRLTDQSTTHSSERRKR